MSTIDDWINELRSDSHITEAIEKRMAMPSSSLAEKLFRAWYDRVITDMIGHRLIDQDEAMTVSLILQSAESDAVSRYVALRVTQELQSSWVSIHSDGVDVAYIDPVKWSKERILDLEAL